MTEEEEASFLYLRHSRASGRTASFYIERTALRAAGESSVVAFEAEELGPRPYGRVASRPF
jgi:hypothetical protein